MLLERTLMERTLDVLDRLVAEDVIAPYAIGGAIAAYKYVEAALTEDLVVLVSLESSGSGIISLTPIFRRLATLGYTDFRREGLMIEGWPVQFLPVASELDREALATAVALNQPAGERSTGKSRVLLPHYLVATALKVGRPKDLLRVSQFLEEEAVDLSALSALIGKHGLLADWRKYCLATGTPFDLLDRGGIRA